MRTVGAITVFVAGHALLAHYAMWALHWFTG